MTHLLPGGGVPPVHGAGGPVPPRLPHFATPRSVHHLAAVAAGAYPPRSPPDVWSPGAPAPPGPCYWLVASGTPLGWRGGCLALGLVRGAVRHCCLGGCSALVVCARRSRPVRGAGAGAWCRASPFPPSRPAFPALCVAGRPVRVSLILARWYAIPCDCAFHGLGPVALLVFPVCPLCVCAPALPRRPRPPPLPWLVWRAHLARSRCWALVGPFHAVRAPPRVLPRSCAPFDLLGGGGGGGGLVPFPPTWPGAVCSPWGGSARLGRSSAGGWGGGGGAACAPFPPTVRPGWPVGSGVALPRSVPLPSLGRQQSRSPWRRSGYGGRGPRTAPVRACLLSPGAVRVAPWCVGAGSLVHRGSCGSSRQGRGGGPCSGLPPGRRGPAGGRGDHPLCLGGGWGPAPPWLAGRWGVGEQGGGSRRGSPPPSLGGAACGPLPSPPFVAGASPPGVRVLLGSGLPPAGQPGGGGGGGEGRPVSCPPGGVAGGPGGRGVVLPRSVPLPSLGGQHCGRHWRPSGHWGARPPYCSGSLSRAAPRRGPCVVLARWCGFARLSRPPREQAVGGAGARGVRVELRPPPGFAVPSGGGGTSPRPRGGWRAGAPVARRPGGGVGGRGEGGPRRCSPAPCPGGWPVAPFAVPLLLRRTPPGYTRSAGVAGRPWAPGAARSAAGGSVWRGGWGGRMSPRRGLLCRLPQAGTKAGRFVCEFLGAAVPLRPTAPARSRRSAAGNAGVSGRSTRGAWRAAALAAAVACPPWVPRPPRGAAGPPSPRPASGRPRAGGGGERGGGGVKGRGASPQSPPGPLAPPPDGLGGAAWWFWSRGAIRRLGGRTLPPPPSTLRVPDPRAGPRSGPLLSSLSPRGAGWAGGGGEGR